MDALFHIGYHKTGSTWLQKAVFPHIRNWALVPRRFTMEELVKPRPFDFDPQRARQALEGGFGDSVLVSEEELSGNPHAAGLNGLMSREVADRLHSVAPQGRVLIFVRNQIEAMASLYVQYVKRGGNYGPRRYLLGRAGEVFRDPFFSWAHLDYWPLVRYYQELFGTDRVWVVPYERLTKDSASLLDELATGLGWDLDWDAVSPGIVNPGYGRNTLRMARFLHAFHPHVFAHKYTLLPVPGMFRRAKRLLRQLNRTPLAGRKVRPEDLLDSRSLLAARDYFRSSNQRLQEGISADLSLYGYPL